MATKMTREEAIKIVQSATVWTDEERDALAMLIPELAESEDEKIRKWIITELKDSLHEIETMYSGDYDNRDEEDKKRQEYLNKALTYLEKQKDSASNNFDDVWNEEDCEDIIAEGQKLTPRFKELLKEVCHAWYDRGAKLEKQKERGPLTKEEEYILHRIIEYLEDETCPSEWISLLHDIYCLPYEKQKEQKPASISRGHEIVKPAEWNDTDMKEARDNLISVCRDWERGMQTALLPIVAVRARYFLEHLTEPKPVEWSEEDEKQGSQKSLRTTKETDVI